MTNKEIAIEILSQSEQKHLNLYHSIPKEEFKIYFDEFLKKASNLTDKEFDFEMLKLFSKFKDGHTLYFVPYKCMNKKLYFLENKAFLKDNNIFKEVVKVGNMNIKDVVENIASMQSYETEERLTDCLRWDLNNQYCYEMLSLTNNDGSVDFSVKNNDKIEIITAKKITIEEYKALSLANNSPFYSYEVINDTILIKYRKCAEHSNYPFIDFVKDIKKEVKSKNVTKYILDLRDNHGGDSSILNPLTKAIKQLNLQGVALIDNGVFSSGRWAVADFKKEFDITLIGEPTGGAAASYGYNKNINVEDKRFSVSIRYWDFSEIFGYKGSIQPDIFVPTTIKDLQEKNDPQLLTAMQYLTNKNEKNKTL